MELNDLTTQLFLYYVIITIEIDLESGFARDSDIVLKVKEALQLWMVDLSIHDVTKGESVVLEDGQTLSMDWSVDTAK